MALDGFSLLALGAALGWLAWRWHGVPSLDALPWMLLAALVGVALADFGTGVVHWAGDTFGNEGTPWVGRTVIAPFRNHHKDPAEITRHGLLEVTGNNALIMTPLVLGMALVAPGAAESVLVVSGLAGGLALVFTAVVSNQLHRWAHMARVPGPVAWLQRRHLILSRVEHSRHHRGPHNVGYCVANGWMNPLLDRLASPTTRHRARST